MTKSTATTKTARRATRTKQAPDRRATQPPPVASAPTAPPPGVDEPIPYRLTASDRDFEITAATATMFLRLISDELRVLHAAATTKNEKPSVESIANVLEHVTVRAMSYANHAEHFLRKVTS